MVDVDQKIRQYYSTGNLMSSIKDHLQSLGKTLEDLSDTDLVQLDAFHIRGKESTLELCRLANFSSAMKVLDLGCGLGGSARHIARTYACRVTGLDLSYEYIEVARQLTNYSGLGSQVTFRQGHGLTLPFEAESFDIIWTEHVQMNIEDKDLFFNEIQRVLVPGGRLAFHDVFQGKGGSPHFPVPWAEESSCSSLTSSEDLKEILTNSGFAIQDWRDKSDHSLQWFKEVPKKKSPTHRPLSIRLLLGDTTRQKLKNIVRNLEEERIKTILGTAIKT